MPLVYTVNERFLTYLRKKFEQQLKDAYDEREKLLDDLDQLQRVIHLE